MKVRELINVLKTKGFQVSFRVRKDGGIRITRIGEKRFTGSEGNVYARAMLGENLSQARSRQLQSIRTPKGRFGNKQRAKISDELMKQLRKAQRQFRKRGVEAGRPTQRNIRYIVKEYGEEEAKRRLSQSMRYAQGLAYEENIDVLISRIKLSIIEGDEDDIRYLQACIRHIEKYRCTFKESWISEIYEKLYDYENGILSSGDLWIFIATLIK